ncbi:MAG: TIGR03118 family protein [Verrucomicrobia bacterium]|nr:TIGR03118 family protein [Verrucomicrobiota bacterium]
MKTNISTETTMTAALTLRRPGLVLAAALLTLASMPASARDGGDRDGGYQQTNLVSDLPGVAVLQDTNLVNAWGISFSATSPFWISDNATGLSTLYSVTNDVDGVVHVAKLGLQVSIPGEGNLTGQLFNGTGAFHGDNFIFASEDGTVSGWRNALGTSAVVLAMRSTAVYKGITLTSSNGQPILLAANFAEGTLDAYGTNLTLLAQFADPMAPAGYAPFNVQSLGGMVFVTFAKQDAEKHDDAPGRGHGLIDVFDPQTGTFHRFATGSDAGGKLRQLDSPWGLALSPTNFGPHADQLLVGNFGSGTIMSFDSNGKFRGLLQDRHEMPIVIEGLWGLAFGNGGRAGVPSTLYFTAGPGGESHGLFGSLNPATEHKHGEDHDHGPDRD